MYLRHSTSHSTCPFSVPGLRAERHFDNYTFYNNFIRGRENVGPGVFDAWSPTNSGSRIPALSLSDANNETRTSDYFNVNTSYFKLLNIQFGYALNADLTQKIKLQRVRMYIMAENLFPPSLKFSGSIPNGRTLMLSDPENTYIRPERFLLTLKCN